MLDHAAVEEISSGDKKRLLTIGKAVVCGDGPICCSGGSTFLMDVYAVQSVHRGVQCGCSQPISNEPVPQPP